MSSIVKFPFFCEKEKLAILRPSKVLDDSLTWTQSNSKARQKDKASRSFRSFSCQELHEAFGTHQLPASHWHMAPGD